jgi:hypothetical protein
VNSPAGKARRLITIGLITVSFIYHFAFIYPQLKPLDIVQKQQTAKCGPQFRRDPMHPFRSKFSDFQYPFCEQFYNETEPCLLYYISTGKVKFTYRSGGNWVSQNIARSTGAPAKTESQDAAHAAYCAADQGKFWEMHDALFANNRDVEDQGSFTSRRLSVIAESINLDKTEYDDCFDGGKYEDQVQQDLEDALAANITGTPFFIITYTVNGETKTKTLDGAQPFSTFQVELEAILNEIGPQ